MRELCAFVIAALGGALYAALFGSSLSGVCRGVAALIIWVGLFLALSKCSPRKGGVVLLCFGLGWFGTGLRWTSHSLIEHGHLPVIWAIAGVFCLALVCSFFLVLAGYLGLRLTRGEPERCVLLASFFVFAEWFRGQGGADFGWLAPAYALLDTPWAGWAPVVGAEGVGVFFLLTSGCLASAILVFTKRMIGAGMGLLALATLLVIGGEGLSRTQWSDSSEPLAYRILQADLPIVDLFARPDPVVRIKRLEELLALNPDARGIVLTPEGVLPTAWSRLSEDVRKAWLSFIEEAASPVVHTNFRAFEGGWANSIFWETPDGLMGVNDKRKLVPFGEFVPSGFRWLVDLLGIPMADLVPGKKEQPLFEDGTYRYATLICYENIDGEVLRASSQSSVPNVVLVVSNLGWFGRQVLGQHLDMSRMRALEVARPVLSVNMNGHSAAIDAKGNVLAMLPDEEAAMLVGEVRIAKGPHTPWVRYGAWPALLFAFLAGVLAWHSARWRRGGL